MAYLLEDLLHRLAYKLGNLHRQGRELKAACPKCGEGEDRFFCGPKYEYRSWHCRQCGYTVPTASLLGQWLVVDHRPTVKAWQAPKVAERPATQLIRDLYDSLTAFSQENLSQKPAAMAYLNERGLDKSTIEKTGLGFLSAQIYREWYNGLTSKQRSVIPQAGLPEVHGTDPFRGFASMFAAGGQGKIVFPYYDQEGNVVDLRTRSISPKDTSKGTLVRYTSPKQSLEERGAAVPYGLDTLRSTDNRIVVTEGEFKRLSLMAAGIFWPVLSLRGTSDPIHEYLDHLYGRQVVLAFDNDPDEKRNEKSGLTPGEMATVRIGRLLRSHGISVSVLDPATLIDQKGVDDFVKAHGAEEMNRLLSPKHTMTMSEFEAHIIRRSGDLSMLATPKQDPGTVRRWIPEEHVDDFAHETTKIISLEEATQQIEQRLKTHWASWRKGQKQLLIVASPGVGKTHLSLQTALKQAETTRKTIDIFLPNHGIIDEKIKDGMLAGFKHMYGRRWDKVPQGGTSDAGDWSSERSQGIRNCRQAESAQKLQQKGYSPGQILCPNCPFKEECEKRGYKAQFKGKVNRAYTHGHLHTDYPNGEDLIIIDELSHKALIGTMEIWEGDIINALRSDKVTGEQRLLLEALLELYTTPALGNLEGNEVYEVVRRFYSDLDNVDAWGDGMSVQMALDEIVDSFIEDIATTAKEQLPQQFGKKLFALMSEDVRRLIAGKAPTGRIRLEEGKSGKRCLVLTYSKGSLPAWYSNKPTVILNATADPSLLKMLMGPIEVLSLQIAVSLSTELIQDVTFNNAKSSLVGTGKDAEARRKRWLDQIRKFIEMHGDESDTTIITVKDLVDVVRSAFPKAKIHYYYALEGRNDLQSGLTILANPPPVNLKAVQREAAALFPGVDTTLIRRSQAFDIQNAGEEFLAVEQVDAKDERVQAILWQHRDAAVVQAVGRARLVREEGRTVVALFSRPIPGLRPTQIVTERNTPTKVAAISQETVDKIISAAIALLDEQPGFTVPALATKAEVSPHTIKKYQRVISESTGVNWLDLPVKQILITGGTRNTQIQLALTSEVVDQTRLYVMHGRYKNDLITAVHHIQSLLPSAYKLDVDALSTLFGVDPTYQDVSREVEDLPDINSTLEPTSSHLEESTSTGTDSAVNAPVVGLGENDRHDLEYYLNCVLTHREMLTGQQLAREQRINVESISLDWGKWYMQREQDG